MNRHDIVDELVDALEAMTLAFQPLTSKPMGAPNSQARADQDAQISAHAKARGTLAKVRS